MKRRTYLATSMLSIAGLSGCLGDTEYRVTEAEVNASLRPLYMSVQLAVADVTIEHPAALMLSLENNGDVPVRIRSYGVWPFGVLALAPSSTRDENAWKTTLFSPSYDSTNRVEVDRGGSSISMDGTPIERTLDSGEKVRRRYELHGEDLPRAGTYGIVENFEGRVSGYSTADGWTSLDYRSRLTIEKKELLPL